MILSDKDIKNYIKEDKIKIEPLKEDQIGSASVDLTLDNEWQIFKDKKEVELNEDSYKEAFKTINTDTIELQPGEMCLGKTVEKITLPGDIIGNLEGRSRYARMGIIIHTTSALIQPGSSNHQILEIVNLAPFKIKLNAGQRISQVVFQKMSSKTEKPYNEFGEVAREQ